MTTEQAVELPVMVCRYCGYKWTPRVAAPTSCPNCKKRKP